jgi:hypothetical protein
MKPPGLSLPRMQAPSGVPNRERARLCASYSVGRELHDCTEDRAVAPVVDRKAFGNDVRCLDAFVRRTALPGELAGNTGEMARRPARAAQTVALMFILA